jgi:hypothetical protein
MMNIKEGLSLATLCLLAACGGAPTEQVAARPDFDDPASQLAPAILAPEESGAPTGPPSYEVGIASAAADHNKALDRCKSQPEAVRTQCEQEANAAFVEVQDQLQDLRGNTQ